MTHSHALASPGRREEAGVTLIELIVTIAVLAVLAAVAAPAMVGLVSSNRLAGASSDLTASLQLARSEALRRGSPVVICGTTDGTTCGGDWSRWIVIGTDNVTGAREVVRDSSASSSVQVSGPGAPGIVFRPSGLIGGQAQLTACVPTDTIAENQRIITVMISGTIVTTRASGGGGC